MKACEISRKAGWGEFEGIKSNITLTLSFKFYTRAAMPKSINIICIKIEEEKLTSV